jgi:hypothetical protein
MKKVNKRIYGVQCPVCIKRMFSFHVHDYKTCGCENETMVDGGRSYLRYGWKTLKPRRIYWCKKDGKYPEVKYKDRFPY